MVKRHFTADAPDNRGGVCSGFEKWSIEEKALNKEQIFFKLRTKETPVLNSRETGASTDANGTVNKGIPTTQGLRMNTMVFRYYKTIRLNTLVNNRIRKLPIEIVIVKEIEEVII